MSDVPPRVQILRKGEKLTTGDRDKTYGAPSVNLGCHGELLRVYQKYAQGKYTPGHDAAMSQMLSKIARIATAPAGNPPLEDSYIDGVNYIAIAYECETKHDAAGQWASLEQLGHCSSCGAPNTGQHFSTCPAGMPGGTSSMKHPPIT